VKHTLEEEGAVETNALGGMWFFDGCTIGGGVGGVVFGLDDLSRWHLFVRKTIALYREEPGGQERGGGSICKSKQTSLVIAPQVV
jgi:hypothetical protein